MLTQSVRYCTPSHRYFIETFVGRMSCATLPILVGGSLIDWEDAAEAPTKAVPDLRRRIHAPQVFKDGHGAEVDIWGVGKLVSTSGIRDLPESLQSLGQRMVEGSILSAERGLAELKPL